MRMTETFLWTTIKYLSSNVEPSEASGKIIIHLGCHDSISNTEFQTLYTLNYSFLLSYLHSLFHLMYAVFGINSAPGALGTHFHQKGHNLWQCVHITLTEQSS